MIAYLEVKDGRAVTMYNIWGYRSTGVGGFEMLYKTPIKDVNKVNVKVVKNG